MCLNFEHSAFGIRVLFDICLPSIFCAKEARCIFFSFLLFFIFSVFFFFFFFTFPLGTSEFLTFVIDKSKGKGRFISLGYNFSNKSYEQGKYIFC